MGMLQRDPALYVIFSRGHFQKMSARRNNEILQIFDFQCCDEHKMLEGLSIFYSVLWLHTEDVQKYCETTVKMNTGTESIVITSENDLSHTHLEADSQLFFPSHG